jgi:hypothetical protein
MFRLNLINTDPKSISRDKTTGAIRKLHSCTHKQSIRDILDKEKRMWMTHAFFTNHLVNEKEKISKKILKEEERDRELRKHLMKQGGP